jgi:hypothetical protein
VFGKSFLGGKEPRVAKNLYSKTFHLVCAGRILAKSFFMKVKQETLMEMKYTKTLFFFVKVNLFGKRGYVVLTIGADL